MAPITTIIGDSMVQKVFGDKLTNSLSNNHHVVVRSFGGAKTQCMEDHIKPTIKLSPNQIIIHCGTNNLPSNEESKIIADNTNNLAKKTKQSLQRKQNQMFIKLQYQVSSPEETDIIKRQSRSMIS